MHFCNTTTRGDWSSVMRKSMYAVSAAALLAMASGAGAQSAPPQSDQLRIFDASGNPVFNQIIQEPTGSTVFEPNLVFDPFNAGPIDPVGIATGGGQVVFLTEPAGEPVNPGETPFFAIDPNGVSVQISDIIVSSLNTPATFPPQVQLISDGSPDLQRLVISQPNFAHPATFLVETGQPQDLTPFFSQTAGVAPFKIFVQSDVSTPEPASAGLLGIAALGLLARKRRA
jgi:hypothetical protein